MPRGRSAEDLSVLEMALIGYQLERQKIDQKIADIQARLGKRRGAQGGASEARPATRKRNLSPEARRRIAAAQKKRWAEHRKKLAKKSGDSQG